MEIMFIILIRQAINNNWMAWIQDNIKRILIKILKLNQIMLNQD